MRELKKSKSAPSLTKSSAEKSKSSSEKNPLKRTQSQESMEFSNLEFSSSSASIPSYLSKKRKQPSKTQLLKKVQEKKRKLQELEGTEKGEAFAKNIAWDTMKKRAQGEKVKDDPKKIKENN